MKRNLFIFILALQSAWVLYTVAVQERALHKGVAILLETRPVDPRDLLRGDYVILNYKVSNVPTKLFAPPLTNALPYGQDLWVALTPRGDFYEIVRASTQRFEAGPGEVLLRGKSRWWDGGRNAPRDVGVDYGLERYFVREGTGEPRGKLTVQAVVPKSGRASIKEVFLDGKPYADAMKEQAR